jgi:signal transduction histidine kinase
MVVVALFGRAFARADRKLALERLWARRARTDAIAAERVRISRELHDSVAHALTGIVLQTAGIRAGLSRGTVSTDQVDEALGTIQSASEQSVRELHRLVGMLREGDDGEDIADGIEEIPALVAATRANGLDVTLDVTGEPVKADPSLARTAFRVVQEGLSNAMRHGGSSPKVAVTVEWSPETVVIGVRNSFGGAPEKDGIPGAEALPSGGFGIVGLRERVVVLGGSLEAGDSGGGYLLRASLPLRELPTSSGASRQQVEREEGA